MSAPATEVVAVEAWACSVPLPAPLDFGAWVATVGGLGAALGLCRAAQAHGRPVSTHVHPELHHHLALAAETAAFVEAFPADRPFDCAHELLAGRRGSGASRAEPARAQAAASARPKRRTPSVSSAVLAAPT